MRLPGALEIERAGLRCWPGLECEWDGAWVRRAANGYTHRANSVQSLDPADETDIPARIAASERWFGDRGLVPVFRVTPLASAKIVETLDALDWKSVDASHLFAMELGDFEPDPRGALYEPLDPQFLSAQQHLRGYSEEKLSRLEALLAVIDVPARGIVLYSDEGRPVASGLMDIADGIVITGNVVTDRAVRRQGYGAAMMRTGLAWAREAGATVAALNVAADNQAGLALYRSLGFRPQYDYVYRTP